MSKDDLLLMALAVLAVGGVLYYQINKVTQKIDQKEANPNLAYSEFCSAIDERIGFLRDLAQSGDLLELDKKDSCLEELSDFSKELVFIESMNANSKDSKSWEEKLFGLLSRLDEFIIKNFSDGEALSERIKDELKSEFDRLKEYR